MNVRRKRPCRSRSKKDKRDDKLDATIVHILSSLDEKKNEGRTTAKRITSLKQMPYIQEKSRFFLYALNAYLVKENKEI